MKTSLNSGFAPIVLILAISALVVTVSGAGYGVYKFNETKQENERLRNEIANKEVPNDSLESDVQEQATSTAKAEETQATTTDDSAKDVEVSKVEAIKPEKEIVYVPQPTPINQSQKQAEIDAAVQAALAEQQSQSEPEVTTPEPEEEPEPIANPQTTFEVVAIRQTAYPDGYGGTYGSYEMEISISSTEADILVPPSTSNTIGTGDIGFSYTIAGDSFRGIQDSKINCGLKQDGFCKIKNDGRARNITVTIFIYPDEESNGNYAVNFEKVYYYKNGSKQEYSVNRQTASINLQY